MLLSALLVVVGFAVLGSVFLVVRHRRRTRETQLAYPAPGEMVDVGGHRLHYLVRGKGRPVVVIDACLNEASYCWFHVQEELAKFATVVCFDRAGHGWSEQGPLPRTNQRCVEELRMLLREEGLPGPYLLCGHSYGGINSRLYASLYPDEVAGLVLVEALNTDTFDDDAPVSKVPFPFTVAKWISMLGTPCVVMPEIYNLPNVPRPEGLWLDMQCRSQELHAMWQEWAGMKNWRTVRDAMKPLGTMPVTVVSANCERYIEWWPETQAALAKDVGDNVEWIQLDCGHLVNIQNPQAVITAVSKMVEKISQDIPPVASVG